MLISWGKTAVKSLITGTSAVKQNVVHQRNYTVLSCTKAKLKLISSLSPSNLSPPNPQSYDNGFNMTKVITAETNLHY